MEDGIVRVLPSLMEQTMPRLSAVFEEAVAVAISVIRHPAQSCLDVWPNLADEVEVCRACGVSACQEHKERRGVDRAVILRKRHLAHRGHFAFARFVQNPPGFASCRAIAEVACVWARYARTPRASAGLSKRHSSAVMRPPRPNGVLNHGTPA
jgi:hypothetical protein